MNDNLKALCKALRSGDYPQTDGALQDDKGFCCLGVGVVIAEKITGGKKFPRSLSGCLTGGYWSSERKSLQEFYGIPSENGAFYYTEDLRKALSSKGVTIAPDSLDPDEDEKERGSLASLNDNKVPFPEIATIIEEIDKLGLWKEESIWE